MQRFSCRAVPDNRRLALVRYADGSDLRRGYTSSSNSHPRRLDLRAPDVVGIVLYPPRTRIVLRERDVVDAEDASRAIEHDCSGARGPLIERKYYTGHFAALHRRVMRIFCSQI